MLTTCNPLPPHAPQGDVTSALLAQLGIKPTSVTNRYSAKDFVHHCNEDEVFWHDEEGGGGAAGQEGGDGGAAARVKRLMAKALDFLMMSDQALFSGAMSGGLEDPGLVGGGRATGEMCRLCRF